MNKQLVAKQNVSYRYLLLAFAIYLLLSSLYLLAVPTGESPDEPGHLQCIEQVSLLGQLPQTTPQPEGDRWWSRGRILSGQMCYHMPLYYLVAGGLQKMVATAVSEPIHYEFPPSNLLGPSPAIFEQPAKASFWTFTEPVHLLALRLFSVLLGGVTVWASYKVAHLLLPRQPLVASFAALLTAVWPQFVYHSRSLNNDTLATALAVGVLVVLLDMRRPERFVWAAVLSFFALFTKLSVAFTAVAVLLIWGVEFWLLPVQRKRYWRYLLISLTIFAIWFLLVFFTPTLWQHATQSSTSFIAFSEKARAWSYWQEVLKLTASSGWVRFGWMNVAAPQSHAIIWWVGLLGTAVLGIWYIARSKEMENGRLQLLICAIWLLLIILSYVQINMNRFQPQFRFALAAIPTLTALSSAGWLRVLKGNGRIAVIGIASIIASLFFYNVWIINSVVHQAYIWW